MVRALYSSHLWCFFCLVVSWENDFDDNKPCNRCYYDDHDDQASIVRFIGPQLISLPFIG